MTSDDERDRTIVEDSLLAATLTGDLDRDAPLLLAHLAAHPEQRTALDELVQIQTALGRTARRMEQDTESARAAVTASDRALVARFVRDRLAPSPPRSTRAPTLRRWIAAAAVVAAGLVAYALLRNDRSEPNPVWLGGTALDLSPKAETAAFDRFAWNAPPRRGVTFELVVYADAGDGARGDVVTRRKTEQPEWTFDAEETRAWPDAIVWEVVTLDRGGQPLSVVEQRTRRTRN